MVFHARRSTGETNSRTHSDYDRLRHFNSFFPRTMMIRPISISLQRGIMLDGVRFPNRSNLLPPNHSLASRGLQCVIGLRSIRSGNLIYK